MFDKSVPPPGARPGPVLLVACTAIFMLMLDTTVVAAALADIRQDFTASLDGLQWVIDAYTLPLAGLLLTFATLGDRLGRKKVFMSGMAVFAVASLALVFAPNALALNVLRAVQGVGAAMLFATALPILSQAYPDRRSRMRAIGVYSAVMGGATAAGPVVGGALVTGFGWRSIFLINVPISIAVIIIASRSLRESTREHSRRSDLPGSALLTAGLVLGVLAITRGQDWGQLSTPVMAMSAAAVGLLAVFVWWQGRSRHPLFDPAILRKPGFVGTALVSFAFMATLMAAANYLALFLMGTLEHSPLQMGLRVLPLTVGALVAAPIAARFLQRLPFSIVLPTGLAVVATGLLLLRNVAIDDDWTHFLPGMIVGGLGIGAVTAANQAASLTFAPPEDAGMSSATFATMRQLGMAVGVAVLGVVFNRVGAQAARDGLLAEPFGALLPEEAREQLTDAIGAGAGVQVTDSLPERLRPLSSDIAQAAHSASVDGINALLNVATASAITALALSVLFFGIDEIRTRRAGRRAHAAEREDAPAVAA